MSEPKRDKVPRAKRLPLMHRVRHVDDELMVGRVLSDTRGDTVLVKWDGGCEQWVRRSLLRPRSL